MIDGQVTSHFLYYVQAFNAIQPNHAMGLFLDDLKVPDLSYTDLISRSYIPPSVQTFLRFTHDVIQSSLLETAAAFAYGREILVPVIFEPLLKQAALDPMLLVLLPIWSGILSLMVTSMAAKPSKWSLICVRPMRIGRWYSQPQGPL